MKYHRLINRAPRARKPEADDVHREREDWRKYQLGRRTELLNRGYTNIDLVEKMSVACVGHGPDRSGSLFMGVLATAMGEGKVAYRVRRTHEAAPARLDGTDRLTTRAQSEVRRILTLGEARGEYPIVIPFTATLVKAGLSGRNEPLHHGDLVVDRGNDMALIGTDRARRLKPGDFPGIKLQGNASRSNQDAFGLPLVVGSSTGAASWALLSERGALAVWCGTYLWTFLATEPFAAPLDALRARVAPPTS